jgi:hypothetical protein
MRVLIMISKTGEPCLREKSSPRVTCCFPKDVKKQDAQIRKFLSTCRFAKDTKKMKK